MCRLAKKVYVRSKLVTFRIEGSRVPERVARTAKKERRREAAASAAEGKKDKMEYREHIVPRGRYRIYTKDYPGEKPAIVLMHGFPDNLHLYDRLVPRLSSRRVVVFDFLGWGRPDKPEGYPYTADNQTRDLGAVIERLGLESVMLVAHNASEPPAIDWALAHPDRTAAEDYGETPKGKAAFRSF